MKALIDTTYDNLKKDILKKYKDLSKERGIDYVENENDEQTLIAEAAAYRLYLLLQDFNSEFESLFLQNAKGARLDDIARSYFGIERLEGVKPRAEVTFKLGPRGVDTIFERNSQFSSSDGDTAYLLADVIIKAGEKTGTGTLILNKLVESSNVKTTIPLKEEIFQFTVEIGKNGFIGGRGKEEDELLRKRCLDSLSSTSTAGSRASYIYHTKTADRRIEQVTAYSDPEEKQSCIAFIRYYANIKTEQQANAKQIAEKDKLKGEKEEGIVKLNEQIAEKDKLKGEKEDENDKLNDEIKKLNTEIAKLNDEIKKLNEDIKELNEQIDQLKGEKGKDNTKKIAEKDKLKGEKEEGIVKLNEQIAEKDQLKREKEDENDKLNDEIKKLNTEIAKLNTEIAKLNTEIAKLNDEIKKLNEDIKELNEQIDKNVKSKLSNDFIKPLGIKLDIASVKEKKYKLKAKVTIRGDVSDAVYKARILKETKQELSKLAKINATITDFQILNIIGIDENVLNVELTITDENDKPLKDKNDKIIKDIICNEEEIPILDEEYFTTKLTVEHYERKKDITT